MNSKKKNILILSVIFFVLAALLAATLLAGRMPMNEKEVTGNTAGNLNNGGYFCEDNGIVYFANAYDHNSLYSMNTDETELKKLNSNSVSLINSGGDYLYYAMRSGANDDGLGFTRGTAGIYRSRKNGKSVLCLARTHAVCMQLCGNYLYYEDYNTKTGLLTTKIKIDKSDKTTVSSHVINPASYSNGLIYYNSAEDDHYLYALNTESDTTALLWEGDLWNPIYQDGYVYYMDVANNYRLCRYSLFDNVVEVLTNDRIDLFNVYGLIIYYQTNSKTEPALKRMQLDGSYPETVAEGVYENINITSQYVYFNLYGEDIPVYKTSTYGDVYVTTFDAARDAAAENIK